MMKKNLKMIENVINIEEEEMLLSEIIPRLQKKAYIGQHWDDVLVRFRETELLWPQWSLPAQVVFERLIRNEFPLIHTFQNHTELSREEQWKYEFPCTHGVFPYVHCMDLHETGFMKAHVDSL